MIFPNRLINRLSIPTSPQIEVVNVDPYEAHEKLRQQELSKNFLELFIERLNGSTQDERLKILDGKQIKKYPKYTDEAYLKWLQE